jgi:hypothetical protein
MRPLSVTESFDTAMIGACSRSRKFCASGRMMFFCTDKSSPDAENVMSKKTVRIISMSTIDVMFSSA